MSHIDDWVPQRGYILKHGLILCFHVEVEQWSFVVNFIVNIQMLNIIV